MATEGPNRMSTTGEIMSRGYVKQDTCRRGHVFTEGSYYWSTKRYFRKDLQKVVEYPVRNCKPCKQIRESKTK